MLCVNSTTSMQSQFEGGRVFNKAESAKCQRCYGFDCILGIQTGRLRNLRFLLVISKSDENASSPKIKSTNLAKNENSAGGLIFQLRLQV